MCEIFTVDLRVTARDETCLKSLDRAVPQGLDVEYPFGLCDFLRSSYCCVSFFRFMNLILSVAPVSRFLADDDADFGVVRLPPLKAVSRDGVFGVLDLGLAVPGFHIFPVYISFQLGSATSLRNVSFQFFKFVNRFLWLNLGRNDIIFKEENCSSCSCNSVKFETPW